MNALSHDQWRAAAADLTPHTQLFINGSFVDAQSTWDKTNPATGEVIAAVHKGTAADIDSAVAAARASFEDGRWSQRDPADRKQVLFRFADLMMEHADELALLDSIDMGKLVTDARNLDIPFSADLFRYYGEAIDKIHGEVVPTGPGVHATITKEPLGVVGAIVPWNYPVDMAAWKLAPAIAAGNSVVLKPASQSPLSALRLAELFAEAGLPDGVLNVVPGFGSEAGQALARHMDVDCLVFTGSTAVGKQLQVYAGESNMKQVWLECGGKSANVVFADTADLDKAAEAQAFDVFFNQGEVCSSHTRLLVEDSIHDEFVARLTDIAKRYQPGDPLNPESGMGAIVDDRQTETIMGFIDRAKAQSTLACGGQQLQFGGSHNFIQPTVFTDVAADSELFHTEVFGPVLAVTRFSGEEEAVKLANSTEYALAASVWTSGLSKAHRMSRRLHAGTVSVNSTDVFGAQLPFGGFKSSGFGRDLSLHALDKFVGLKTTWIEL